MENKIYELLLDMQKDIKDIKNTVEKIEASQTEDVIAMLKIVSKGTRYIEKDVEHLAGKVGEHDMILNRLNQN